MADDAPNVNVRLKIVVLAQHYRSGYAWYYCVPVLTDNLLLASSGEFLP